MANVLREKVLPPSQLQFMFGTQLKSLRQPVDNLIAIFWSAGMLMGKLAFLASDALNTSGKAKDRGFNSHRGLGRQID